MADTPNSMPTRQTAIVHSIISSAATPWKRAPSSDHVVRQQGITQDGCILCYPDNG